MYNTTNNSDPEKPDPYTAELLIFFSLIIFSTFLCMLTLLVIFMSRSIINQFEFYTLVILYSILTCSRINYAIVEIYGKFAIGCISSILNNLNANLEILSNSSYFYYSLLQISMLSRVKFMLVLFKFTHSKKGIIVFHVTVGLIVMLQSLLIIQHYIDNCVSLNKISLGLFIYCIEILLSRAIIVLCYVMAMAFICVTRLRNCHHKRESSLNELSQLRRFRQNAKLMIKFLALSASFIFIDLVDILPIFIQIQLSLMFTYLNNLIYILQPLMLLFVHNVLKRKTILFIKSNICGRFIKKEN